MPAPSVHAVSSDTRLLPAVINKVKAYVALTKPRIVLLMVFSALCSAIVAEGGWPEVWTLVHMSVGLALCAAGASAFNMWYDRDMDQLMERTIHRPLPTGRIRPQSALWFGLGLGLLSLIWLAVFVNGLSALLALAGYLYYTVIYTVWLKRRTPLNIVIGGGAGALPPMVGCAAVTGEIGWTAVWLFAIIFVWTPPHFWPLAMVRNEEYRLAHVPMMPAVRGFRVTKRQCLVYTVLLLPATLGLAMTGAVGGFYLVAAVLAGLAFLAVQIRMWREADDEILWARRAFRASLAYLTVLFAAMAMDVLI
jgi:heme o synthase